MQPPFQANTDYKNDLFISHASEDKEDFVRPLKKALTAEGLQVWYDDSEITVGDIVNRKIDEGISQSRYATVILSPAYLISQWCQLELTAIFTRLSAGKMQILPIKHGITQDEMIDKYPTLAGIVALDSSAKNAKKIEQIAREVAEVVKPNRSRASAEQSPTAPPSRQPHNFAVFYVAPKGTSAPAPGPIPDPPHFQTDLNKWFPIAENKGELEYVLAENTLRIRYNAGNIWSRNEMYAQLIIRGHEPFALTIRPATGPQRYFPSVKNASQAGWDLTQTNPSGWMTFQVLNPDQ